MTARPSQEIQEALRECEVLRTIVPVEADHRLRRIEDILRHLHLIVAGPKDPDVPHH